jgi:uncharacterized membrane protein (DUF106 family)
MNKISERMSNIRKDIRATQGDSKLSNADKREKLRSLQDKINQLAEQGNSLVNERVPY